MTELTIVAHITAQLDKHDLVRAELQRLIAPTRAEAGCLQYDLHQDNEDPSRFLFFERWGSRELWQAHMSSPHLAAFVAATEGALAELTVAEMSPIG